MAFRGSAVFLAEARGSRSTAAASGITRRAPSLSSHSPKNNCWNRQRSFRGARNHRLPPRPPRLPEKPALTEKPSPYQDAQLTQHEAFARRKQLGRQRVRVAERCGMSGAGNDDELRFRCADARPRQARKPLAPRRRRDGIVRAAHNGHRHAHVRQLVLDAVAEGVAQRAEDAERAGAQIVACDVRHERGRLARRVLHDVPELLMNRAAAGEHGRRVEHERRRELRMSRDCFGDDLTAMRLSEQNRRADAAHVHPRRERIGQLGEREMSAARLALPEPGEIEKMIRCENSDVLPAGSVAVAETLCPG